MIQNGSTLQETATQIGVSKQLVSTWLKGSGIISLYTSKTEQAKATALELIREGKSSRSLIIKITGLSSAAVARMIKKEAAEIPRQKRTRRYHHSYEEAVKDMQSGMSYTEVAKKYNLTVQATHRWAVNIGINTKKISRAEPLKEKMIEYASQGKSANEVGRLLGLSSTTILRVSRKFGGDHLFRNKLIMRVAPQ